MDKMKLKEFRPHGSTGSGEPKEVPLWFALLIISAMIGVVFSIIKIESKRIKKERVEYLKSNFSRMSDDAEIQQAYIFEEDTLTIESP